jgi:adenine-specific DNA glycosylase
MISKPIPKACQLVTGIFVTRGRALIQRRPAGGLWSGLWEFPTLEINGMTARQTLTQFAETVVPEAVENVRRVGRLIHVLTHRVMKFEVFEVYVSKQNRGGRSMRWVDAQGFKALPVSTAHRRIHELWLGSRAGEGPTRSKDHL